MGFTEASAGDEGEHQVYAKEVADKKVIEVLFMKALDTGYGFYITLGTRSRLEPHTSGEILSAWIRLSNIKEAAFFISRCIRLMQQLAMDSSQPRFEHFALILAARFADSPSLHLQLSTDSKIGKFWTGMSKKDEREQAEIVLEVAFGEGPNGLSPDDARYVHDAGRGMKENDYDQFLKCFKDTLKDINKVANIIPKEKVDEAVDNFNKFKKSFVK